MDCTDLFVGELLEPVADELALDPVSEVLEREDDALLLDPLPDLLELLDDALLLVSLVDVLDLLEDAVLLDLLPDVLELPDEELSPDPLSEVPSRVSVYESSVESEHESPQDELESDARSVAVRDVGLAAESGFPCDELLSDPLVESTRVELSSKVAEPATSTDDEPVPCEVGVALPARDVLSGPVDRDDDLGEVPFPRACWRPDVPLRCVASSARTAFVDPFGMRSVAAFFRRATSLLPGNSPEGAVRENLPLRSVMTESSNDALESEREKRPVIPDSYRSVEVERPRPLDEALIPSPCCCLGCCVAMRFASRLLLCSELLVTSDDDDSVLSARPLPSCIPRRFPIRYAMSFSLSVLRSGAR